MLLDLIYPLQPNTEDEDGSSSGSGDSTATTVPLEEAFPAGATALPGPCNPFVGGLNLQALPDQVTKGVMFC